MITVHPWCISIEIIVNMKYEYERNDEERRNEKCDSDDLTCKWCAEKKRQLNLTSVSKEEEECWNSASLSSSTLISRRGGGVPHPSVTCFHCDRQTQVLLCFLKLSIKYVTFKVLPGVRSNTKLMHQLAVPAGTNEGFLSLKWLLELANNCHNQSFPNEPAWYFLVLLLRWRGEVSGCNLQRHP